MKVGIGLTVHNRNLTARKTLNNILKNSPKEAKVVVVDDASKTPFKGATYRFDVNVGVAKAKNKCLELLQDCDYIFLFDDDCYPITKGWHLHYIDSGVQHLSYTFDKLSNGRPNGNDLLFNYPPDRNLNVYKNPCGCMVYLTKKCLEIVGGYNIEYHRYGYEHVELSMRICNAGLIPHPFMDVVDSNKLFRSLDREAKVTSSVSNRHRYILKNKSTYEKYKGTSVYMPYKDYPVTSHKDVVLTAYFNYSKDTQRGSIWKADISQLGGLIQSCIYHKQHLYVFTNCFSADDVDSEYIHIVEVIPSQAHSPNVYRWIVYDEWMRHNTFDSCWMVDSTDVVLLKPAFDNIQPYTLYCGYEYGMPTDNRWMRLTQERYIKTIPDYRDVIREYAEHPLLNCGIVGGNYDTIRPFVQHWADTHRDNTVGLRYSTDMAVFNYVVHKYYHDIIEYGDHICTKFKYEETDNKQAIWKHK